MLHNKVTYSLAIIAVNFGVVAAFFDRLVFISPSSPPSLSTHHSSMLLICSIPPAHRGFSYSLLLLFLQLFLGDISLYLVCNWISIWNPTDLSRSKYIRYFC
jgi:hypothetical protein